MPKISVISGAYNIENCYSRGASLNSILNQSYSDFEFIICNDGSTDKTAEFLKELSSRDERVKILTNEKNLGLAASLNKCLAEAKGEYIARHDCDDVSSPERFLKQIEYLDKNPDVAFIGTYTYLFDKDGVWGELTFPEKVKKKDFLFSSPYQHGSVMFRREALIKAGAYRVAKETRRAEDYDLFMTLATFASGENLPEFLYYFCEDKNTLARRKYKYRIDEVKVRYRGFKKLGLLPRGVLYVIKPLVVGLIPRRLLGWLKNKLLPRRKKTNTKEKTNSEN